MSDIIMQNASGSMALTSSRETHAMALRRSAAEVDLRAALFKAPSLMTVLKSLDPKELYTVELPPEVWTKIRTSAYTWDKSTGLLSSTIRNARTGEFVKNVKLRPTSANVAALSALSQHAVQARLGEIVARLEEIDAKLERLLAAVTDDRYGKVDAGLNLYRLAVEMEDVERRQAVMLHALPLLAEGRAQLLRSVTREMATLEAPSDLKLLFGTMPIGPGPLDRFVARFKEASENTMVAMSATRAMVVVLESCGESSAAWLAVQQLLDATDTFVKKAAALQAHIPTSRSSEVDDIFLRLSTTKLLELQPVDDNRESLRLGPVSPVVWQLPTSAGTPARSES